MTSIVSTEHLEELQSAIQSIINNDTDQALEILHGILAKNPRVPEALHLLGLCSVLLGDVGRGIELINNAHELDGECRDYVDALASLKAKTGDLNASLYFAKLATTLEPHPELLHLVPANLKDYASSLSGVYVSTNHLEGMLAFLQRNFAVAVDKCERELRLNPTSTEALLLLGKSLTELGEHPRAEIALSAAEQLAPENPEVATALARSLILQGKNEDALACLEYAAQRDKSDVAAVAAHIYALSFMDDAHWQARTRIDDLFLARAKALGIEKMDGGDAPTAGKIRIGILADCFYSCDDALVLETFLRHYNRSKFEVFCLQQSIRHDRTTDRIKTLCDSWRPVHDLDDYVLASIISGDGIQVLIDLICYGPNQRRATLAANPAPLQVAWLNHLDGTGKDVIDLILADPITAYNDRHTALPGQMVEEIETSLFAFADFGMMGDVTPLPALEHDTITFGAYADMARVSPAMAMAWCQVLKEVPRSLLVLNVEPNLPPEIRTGLAARFAHFGMSRRVVFLDKEPEATPAKHMDPEQAFFAGVDILLDAPAHTNAARVARALWMGIPVLTLDTGRRSGQIAASVLYTAGKKDWIARTPQDLVSIAKILTGDFAALDTIRHSLRDDIKGSALFKGRDFAREIETAIEMALERKNIL